jgi:hypothetical protein
MATRLIVLTIALVCIGALALPAISMVNVGFEQGVTRNLEPIGDLIPGLRFTTTGGGGVCFGYIGDAQPYNYLWKSDNGKQDPQWDLWMSGDCAAFVVNPDDVAVINFLGDTASFFQVGYSSGRTYSFKIEAYDSAGHLLGPAVTGLPHCSEEYGGAPGLAYLSLSYANMSSIKLYSDPASGGCWIMDNISYTPTSEIPEPSALLALALGLVPLVLRRRR